jgi:hypothetical protein
VARTSGRGSRQRGRRGAWSQGVLREATARAEMAKNVPSTMTCLGKRWMMQSRIGARLDVLPVAPVGAPLRDRAARDYGGRQHGLALAARASGAGARGRARQDDDGSREVALAFSSRFRIG